MAFKSINVWNSPEFQAFCKRFNIELKGETTALTIHLPIRGLLSVDCSYLPKDRSKFGEVSSEMIEVIDDHMYIKASCIEAPTIEERRKQMGCDPKFDGTYPTNKEIKVTSDGVPNAKDR